MGLAARGLSKSYGGVRVLHAVDLDLAPGEIRALVGENGAGKSTFIKIVTGAVVPDAGTVALDGTPLPLGSPSAVRTRGVSIVYQEFTLVPELTVTENVFLGREPSGLRLPRRAMEAAVRERLRGLGSSIDPGAIVRTLSVAHQQTVEIVRALMGDARVLILDEPSATLSARDVSALFDVLRQLRRQGLGIIYVSHRLEEIFEIADTVTVLRDGRHVTTMRAADLDRGSLIRHMVGRDVSEEFPARTATIGGRVLEVDRLEMPPRLRGVTLDVRRGEIVGVAGLVGAGRTSAALAIAGATPSHGRVSIDGRPVAFRTPADAIAGGVAYVTEDRKRRGVFARLATGQNITITHLSRWSTMGVVSRGRETAAAAQAVKDFDIRTAGLTQPAGTLSGGNQQKALLARYLMVPPKVLVVDEPTRGVDVGARAEIYRLLNRLTGEGLAILMISSDLQEILGMSDRVVVMREGRTVGELQRSEATAERVMRLATGGA